MRPTTIPDKPYTNEEIAQRVRQHFGEEKHTMCDYNDTCKYADMSERARGCAVGCLVTAETAEAWDYIGTIYQVFHEEPTNTYEKYFTREQLPLLRELQRAHDGTVIRDEIYERLDDVLKRFGL